jgi:hypothetical protein
MTPQEQELPVATIHNEQQLHDVSDLRRIKVLRIGARVLYHAPIQILQALQRVEVLAVYDDQPRYYNVTYALPAELEEWPRLRALYLEDQPDATVWALLPRLQPLKSLSIRKVNLF